MVQSPPGSGDKIKTRKMDDCGSHLCPHCSPFTSQSFCDGRPRREMVAGGSQESHHRPFYVGKLRLFADWSCAGVLPLWSTGEKDAQSTWEGERDTAKYKG